MQYPDIRLLAIDLDGTLLDNSGRISEQNRAALRAAQRRGVQVVLATGRDYDGIPWAELDGVTLDYVITTNGSSLYRIADRACLYEHCLPCEEAAEIFAWLLQHQVYADAYIDGHDYAPRAIMPLLDRLVLPEHILACMRRNRVPLDDAVQRLRSGELHVQKGTLNFWRETDGTPHAYNETFAYLSARPGITTVDGGLGNLEFTAAGTSKADGLQWLVARLGVTMAQTMALGDSENDAAILKAAGLGVAMANAPAAIRSLADAVTASNAQNGVAQAVEHYILAGVKTKSI